MCFESGGGRRDHDKRHVFGGCRCIRNVKDRISSDMPQTAIRNYYAYVFGNEACWLMSGRRGCKDAKAALRKTTLMS